jgi:hypothetical protein
MVKDKEQQLTELILKLQDNGVVYAYCYYSGGGDSGAIEEVYGFNNRYSTSFNSGDLDSSVANIAPDTHHADYSLDNAEESILEEFFLTKLNNVEDWWNNDGGYGYMAVRLSDLEFKINNHCYYTQTEVYDHVGKMEIE